MNVAVTPMMSRSTAKEALAFIASQLPVPATNTTAVWMSV